MRTQNTQAKHVPAGFGYSHVKVGNTLVYTTKIRTKQFDLLRYAIEHKRREDGKLKGAYSELKRNKNHKTYVTYEFVTTNAQDAEKFRRDMDMARADVLALQALRLSMQQPWYEPIWMTAIREKLYKEESPAWYEESSCDDLPF